jgi:hypothetical protein
MIQVGDNLCSEVHSVEGRVSEVVLLDQVLAAVEVQEPS